MDRGLKMLNVYAWSYGSVGMTMLGSLIIWRILAKCIRQDIWKVMNAVGAVVALLIILRFTVIEESHPMNIVLW